MVKLWDPERRTILLTDFSGSTMHKDKGSNEMHKFWRTKSYAYGDDMFKPERERDFSEPYQYFQWELGGTYNDYISPFIVQVNDCNINCKGCFTQREKIGVGGVRVSINEILSEFIDSGKKTLRISGGEPFLAREFIEAMFEGFEEEDLYDRSIIVDTNLLGCEKLDYVDTIKTIDSFVNTYCVIGCFKGLSQDDCRYMTGKDVLETQLNNASAILSSIKYGTGKLFFYVPEILRGGYESVVSKVLCFILILRNFVHINAPLRTTVLRWKEYETNKDRFPERTFPTKQTRKIWNEALLSYYSPEQVWLPQYQVEMEDENA